MKVVKRRGMLWCDGVCVDFVHVSTKPMGDHHDNTKEDHGYYGKLFKAEGYGGYTRMLHGCDDCDL